MTVPGFSSTECLGFQLPGPTPTILAVIYRPPKPNSDFLNQFDSLLAHLSSLSFNVMFGDLHIHIDNDTHPVTRDFSSCLHSHGFFLSIDTPTVIKGHILDLICCSGLTPLNCTIADLNISDRLYFFFSIPLCL